MDQQNTTSAGPANTPPRAVESAADHQIPSDTSATPGEGRSSGDSSSGAPLDRAMSTAESRVNQAMDRAADRLGSAATRLDSEIDRRTEGATGGRARAGEMGHSVAETLDAVSRYLRENDAQGLRRDLERQVRERPLQTLLIAVAAGWVTGKILR